MPRRAQRNVYLYNVYPYNISMLAYRNLRIIYNFFVMKGYLS